MNNNIAIIIPAFRGEFLYETLSSLANQNYKNFNVYIGDDCSPDDIEKISQQFNDLLNIKYKRFDYNLGGKNLVDHWNRCLTMIQNEEWFQFFSDDDVLDSNCIYNLNEAINREDFDVFRFELKIIGRNNELVDLPQSYPTKLSALDFYKKLYSNEITARMPEFVFRTSNFKDLGGFVDFPMAMRSDNATVIKCAFTKGIYSISNNFVGWRDTGYNVSRRSSNKLINLIQFQALLSFFEWISKFCDMKNVSNPLSNSAISKFVIKDAFELYKKVGLKHLIESVNDNEYFSRKKLNLFFGLIRFIMDKSYHKVIRIIK